MQKVNYLEARVFRRRLEQVCDEIALRHGFVRRKPTIHYLPRDSQILGDVRFPYTISSITTLRRTVISPVMGIVHLKIAAIKHKLLGLDDSTPPGIQLRQSLIHLTPPPWDGYKVFVDQDNQAVFERIEHDLVAFGLPWIEQNASLKAIIVGTAPKMPEPDGYWFDYLIALGLDGQLERLRERAEYQDKYCNQSPIPGYQNYRKFLADVTQYFGVPIHV